jgi:hypothetical protein
MPFTIAEASRLALILNAISSWLLLIRWAHPQFRAHFPQIFALIVLDTFSSNLFATFGADSKVSSDFFCYTTALYCILLVLAATEVFKELFSRLEGLRKLIRVSILRWQLIGLGVGVCALAMLIKRWGTPGFDCLTFVSTEALRCTALGLTGFVWGTYRHLAKLKLKIPPVTKFLFLWFTFETVPNGLVLWIGMAFFPYSDAYIDVCNLFFCCGWTLINVSSIWLRFPQLDRLPSANTTPSVLSSFETLLDKLLTFDSKR